MVISIANQKGGVGKTTLSVTFSNYLIELGKELLVIDFDFQSSFYNLWNDEKNLYENSPPYEVIQKELSEASNVIDLTKDLKNNIILFDLPGKLDDNNFIPIFENTDALLIPFSYDKICVESTLFFIQLVNHINSEIQLIFIPNRIKSGVKYKTKNQVDETLKKYGVITSNIPDRICFQRLSTYSNSKEINEVVNSPYDFILNQIK